MTLLLLLLMQSCLQAPTAENKKEKNYQQIFRPRSAVIRQTIYHNNYFEINSAGSLFLLSEMALSKFTSLLDCMSK